MRFKTRYINRKQKSENDDNLVKDDSLGDGEASEDEDLSNGDASENEYVVEGKAVEDTDDLGDDDAEDVTEQDDNLGYEDNVVKARAKPSRLRMTSAMMMRNMSLRTMIMDNLSDLWKLRIRMMLNDKMLVYKWQCLTELPLHSSGWTALFQESQRSPRL